MSRARGSASHHARQKVCPQRTKRAQSHDALSSRQMPHVCSSSRHLCAAADCMCARREERTSDGPRGQRAARDDSAAASDDTAAAAAVVAAAVLAGAAARPESAQAAGVPEQGGQTCLWPAGASAAFAGRAGGGLA